MLFCFYFYILFHVIIKGKIRIFRFSVLIKTMGFSKSRDQPGAELLGKQRDPGGVILGGPLTCWGGLERELVNKVRKEQK